MRPHNGSYWIHRKGENCNNLGQYFLNLSSNSKVVVEKLLRACPEISKIYMIIRQKKGMSSEQRLAKYISLPIFSIKLRLSQDEKLQAKLVAIHGDISLPNAGLAIDEQERLATEVDIILHIAANINLSPSLRDALGHNFFGTQHVLQLAQRCQNLSAFVHVSTAYAYCQQPELEEILPPMLVTPEEVSQHARIDATKDLETWVQPYLEGRPNYYTFTKALAEHLVVEQRGDIPVAIVRPSVVVSSYQEPDPGWISNFNSPAGMVVLNILGICRIFPIPSKVHNSVVPVDFLANAIIAAAWSVAKNRPTYPSIYHLSTLPVDGPNMYESMNDIRRAQK